MARPPALKSFIEVQRKFLPTEHLKPYLDGGTRECYRSEQMESHDKGLLCGLNLLRQPDKIIRDTYYDFYGQLVSKKIWIRCRRSRVVESNEVHRMSSAEPLIDWEAKVRIGGNFTDSQFLEIQGKPQAEHLVSQNLQSVGLEHLDTTADLETYRRTWVIDELLSHTNDGRNEISIVLDTVTLPDRVVDSAEKYSHHVGEVEMTCEIVGGDTTQEHEDLRRRAAASMKQKLDEFMTRHEVLFQTSPKPKGKLSAYFEWKGAVTVDACTVGKKT